jgi:hypothetical protein
MATTPMGRAKSIAFVSWLALGQSISSSFGACSSPVDYCYCAPMDGSPNFGRPFFDADAVPETYVLVRAGIDNGCTQREIANRCVQVAPPQPPAGPLAPPELDVIG